MEPQSSSTANNAIVNNNQNAVEVMSTPTPASSNICPPTPVSEQYPVVNPNSFRAHSASISAAALRNAEWQMGINSAISCIMNYFSLVFIIFIFKCRLICFALPLAISKCKYFNVLWYLIINDLLQTLLHKFEKTSWLLILRFGVLCITYCDLWSQCSNLMFSCSHS